MSTCPETTDRQHRWETFTIPSRTHDADGRISTVPGRTVRACFLCAEEARS